MKMRYILPVFAALMLSAAPVFAETHAAEGAPAKTERSLADMWDRKPHGDKKYGADKYKADPDRRAAIQAEKEKIKNMSAEERAAYMEAKHAERKARMLERIEKMPPEQQAEARARMEEFEARREAAKAELMALPPEERAERMKQMRAEMKDHNKKRGGHAERFQKRWDAASAEDRAAFCARAVTECAGEDKPRLCEKSAALCAQ